MLQATAYLGVGSNLGDRAANLLRAISGLTGAGLAIEALSSIFETEPVDYTDQPPFLNLVVAVDATGWDPWQMMGSLLTIEEQLGRQRTIPRGPRTVDLDLLLFGDRVLSGQQSGVELVLPHPRMHLRRFVLAPLCELAPGLAHPTSGLTVAQLLAQLADTAAVAVYRE